MIYFEYLNDKKMKKITKKGHRNRTYWVQSPIPCRLFNVFVYHFTINLKKYVKMEHKDLNLCY